MKLHKKLIFSHEIPNESAGSNQGPLQFEAHLQRIILEIKKSISNCSVLLLTGELGAGKTTFTRFFCETFQLNSVQSPTYAIHQVYQNDQIRIHHFDLYRLEDETQIESSGFWDILQNKKDFFIIEWAEKLGADQWFADRDSYQLQITVLANSRLYQFYKLV